MFVKNGYNHNAPSGGEKVEGVVQVEVEVAIKVTSDELIDLFFCLKRQRKALVLPFSGARVSSDKSQYHGVQVLELVEVPFDIEPIRCDHVSLALDEVLSLFCSDVRHSSEDM